MQTLQTVALVLATVTVGLIAGLFAGFAYAVMPALRTVDDRTFITVMQRINVVILNPLFMLIFLGMPLFSAAAVAVHLGGDHGNRLPWLVAAFVLSAATFLITVAVNVPLNNALAGAGDPDRITDPAEARAKFEQRWVRANVLRSLTPTAALACLILAVVQ